MNRTAALAALLLTVLWTSVAAAPRKQTVCTITVNSSDEKETFRRYLPESDYAFVELVEPGRPDWLASSCRAGVSCDALVISGHFDGDNQFFSDRVEADEHLTVSELERASCSNSCPGLFARLKEVYLFGCNTLNPQRQSRALAEVIRGLVDDGLSRREAERELKSLIETHGQSSLHRMRQLFSSVPVIYGFASTAPLGPTAGEALNAYFRSSRHRRVADGRVDAALVRTFSPFSMVTATGVGANEPLTEARQDMCRFADDRRPIARKLAFVHELLQRPGNEARLYLDRIERLASAIDASTRTDPAVAAALAQISRDASARERFLANSREASQESTRVRMVTLAETFGWLTHEQRQEELRRMLSELQARPKIGLSEIDLACELNADRELDGAFTPPTSMTTAGDDVAHAAMRACLGSQESRARTLDALTSQREADVQVARAYLRHRPVTDKTDLLRITRRIATMEPGAAQVRALGVLARHYVSDPGVLELLTRLYAQTPSTAVQNAVAGVLIRADRRSINPAELRRVLTQNRRPAESGDGMVSALLARLALP